MAYTSITDILVDSQDVDKAALRAYMSAREVAYLEDFGAVGDGSTDDSAALIEAFAWLAAGNRTLSIGEGTYIYTDDLEINGASNIAIIGKGKASQLRADPGVGARPIVIKNTTGVWLCGVYFNDNNDTGGPSAHNNCDIQNCSDVVVEFCRFEGANFYGLGIYQDTSEGAVDAACNNVVVRHNEFIDVGTIGLEVFPKVKSYNFQCYGNYFEGCGENPAGFSATPCAAKPGQSYVGAKVYDNVVKNCTGGFYLGNYETLECYNNTFIDTVGRSISLSVTTHPYPYTPGNTYVKIYGNKIIYETATPSSSDAVNINGTVTTNGPVIFEANEFIGCYDGVYATGSAAFPGLKIINNKFIDMTGPRVISVYDVSGASPAAPVIMGNEVYNNDLTRAHLRIEVDTADGTKIIGNRLHNMGASAIVVVDSDKVIIDDNDIYGYNVEGSATTGAITVTNSSAHTIYVMRNRLYTGDGTLVAFYSGNSATPTVIARDNWCDSLIPFATNSTPNVDGGLLTAHVNTVGKRREFYGSAAPSSGSYQVGDRVWNTAPTAGGTMGWVCTAGGTPGTWKTFGAVSA